MDAVRERKWWQHGYASFTDENTVGGLTNYINTVNTNNLNSLNQAITELQQYKSTMVQYLRTFLNSGIGALPSLVSANGLSSMNDDQLVNFLTNLNSANNITITTAESYLNDVKNTGTTSSNDANAINLWKNNPGSIGGYTNPVDTFIPKIQQVNNALSSFQNNINNLSQQQAAQRTIRRQQRQLTAEEQAAQQANTQAQAAQAQAQQAQTQAQQSQSTANTMKIVAVLAIGAALFYFFTKHKKSE